VIFIFTEWNLSSAGVEVRANIGEIWFCGQRFNDGHRLPIIVTEMFINGFQFVGS
jgi:hypothetical protein